MKLVIAAALTVCMSPGLALAASVAPALTAPAPKSSEAGPAPTSVRIAMHQETLPPGGKLAEHRPTGERYLFVASGRLKVSDLVTGEEQLVEAGKMAAETPGDWHVAQALGTDPVTLYVIDRTRGTAAQDGAGGGGN